MTKRDELDFAEAVTAQRERDDHTPLVNYLLAARPLSAANKITVANAINKLVRKVAAAKVPGTGEQPPHPEPKPKP